LTHCISCLIQYRPLKLDICLQIEISLIYVNYSSEHIILIELSHSGLWPLLCTHTKEQPYCNNLRTFTSLTYFLVIMNCSAFILDVFKCIIEEVVMQSYPMNSKYTAWSLLIGSLLFSSKAFCFSIMRCKCFKLADDIS
jgi:hypothetical protein